MGFVGNYVPCGLSPQTDGMPVIQKQDAYNASLLLYLLYIRLFAFIFVKRYIFHYKYIFQHLFYFLLKQVHKN